MGVSSALAGGTGGGRSPGGLCQCGLWRRDIFFMEFVGVFRGFFLGQVGNGMEGTCDYRTGLSELGWRSSYRFI